MPFRFSYICELLCALEKFETREPPLLRVDHQQAVRTTVESWFKSHRRAIDASDTNGVAFLSLLFPERRTDRVYGMQAARLSKIVARCLSLNSDRSQDLQAWKMPGRGDLGACTERVQKVLDAVPCQAIVSIDEIDAALQELASKCSFSSPDVRANPSKRDAVDILQPIFRKLRSWEAKWLVREILKDFGLLTVDENLILKNYHFLLPSVLRFQSTFHAAVALLGGPLMRYHSSPDVRSQKVFREEAAKLIRPNVGIKVGRPVFHKARSIDHCLKLIQKRRYSVERKYDGEYCEIHVDLSRSQDIQIFSKSGKDSTEDRRGIHDTLRDGLRIGQPCCKFKKRCILLGELLVYCDKDERILEFHKIRKHVSRSGRFLGTDEDSQAHPHEHLMLVLYDVLLVDDYAVMVEPYEKRRQWLRDLTAKKRGRIVTSEWKIVDFSEEEAAATLMFQFAASEAARCEGLVLKPADLPYFPMFEGEQGASHGTLIKLKKDYMQALGEERDIADFVVVGASYDAQQAQRSTLRNTRWTTFYLGCSISPEASRFATKPSFRVVAAISSYMCVPEHDLIALNELGQFRSKLFNASQEPEQFRLLLENNLHTQMQVTFKEPFVVEVLGSGFEKLPNQNLFMLRHPRILKVHLDRTWKDAVTLEELQNMADEAKAAPAEGESQETARLLERLERRIVQRKVRDTSRALYSPISAASFSPGLPRGRVSPLTRMDTAEFRRGEEQFVTPASFSKAGLSSAIKNTDSLHTPPVSSGIMLCAQSLESLNQDFPKRVLSTQRKRTADQAASHDNQETTPSKRTKTYDVRGLQRNVLESHLRSKFSWTSQQKTQPITPLADITKISPRLSPRVRSRTGEGKDQQFTETPMQTIAIATDRKRNEGELQAISRTNAMTTSFWKASKNLPLPIPGVCTLRDSTSPRDCPFTNKVVYVSPCIVGHHFASKDLLEGHGAIQVLYLTDWDREIMNVPPLSDVVGESQAYPGMDKMVLLETNRLQESIKVLQEIEKAKLRDEISLYDWRLLEDLAFFERMNEAERAAMSQDMRQREATLWQTWSFGKTSWDREKDRLVFTTGPRAGLRF